MIRSTRANVGLVLPTSTRQKREDGRALRKRLPRQALAKLSDYDRNPIAILDQQNASRVPELIPLRVERMSQSAFAFYRGSAAIMAVDLAADENTGMLVGSCGDAHIANFGFYASPQRTLMFDLNDFDEAAFAPWEWDLKRLVTSVVIAGQATSRSGIVIETAVLAMVEAYAMAMNAAATMDPLTRFFTMFDVDSAAAPRSKAAGKVLREAIRDARKRTGARAVRRLTTTRDDGTLRFIDVPPTMTHVVPDTAWDPTSQGRAYFHSAGPDISQLARHYTITDVARRVVGVGSVGTRCSLLLLQDGDGHALILQSKEANRSVLEQFGGITQPTQLSDHIAEHGEGARVVGMQRVLQAVSDPFLGHLQMGDIDLYIRQFHDMKGGIEAESLEDVPFDLYARACAVILARAHSQSPQAAVISGYIGSGRALGRALLVWALGYVERAKADFQAFVAARSPE